MVRSTSFTAMNSPYPSLTRFSWTAASGAFIASLGRGYKGSEETAAPADSRRRIPLLLDQAPLAIRSHCFSHSSNFEPQ